MQQYLLPLTVQTQILETLLVRLDSLVLKGESALTLHRIQEDASRLYRSVVAQIEMGKEMQRQDEEKERVAEEAAIKEREKNEAIAKALENVSQNLVAPIVENLSLNGHGHTDETVS